MTMRSRGQRAGRGKWSGFIGVIALMWIGMIPAGSEAASGGTVTLPMGGMKNRSGLMLELDNIWVTGSGYRPIRVRVFPQPPGPAPADRTLTVFLRPNSWNGGAREGGVTAEVTLKQGELFGEVYVPVPQTCNWHALQVETREGGWRVRELSIDNLGIGSGYWYESLDSMAAIVVVHPTARWRPSVIGGELGRPEYPPTQALLRGVQVEWGWVLMPGGHLALLGGVSPLRNSEWGGPFHQIVGKVKVRPHKIASEVHFNAEPDIRALASCFPEVYLNNSGRGGNVEEVFSTQTPATDAMMQTMLQALPNLDVIPPEALPDRWLDYSNIDVLIISRSELAAIRQHLPERAQALLTWLRTGTMLVVYDAGPHYEHLAEIERLTEAQPLPASAATAGLRGWQAEDPQDPRNSVSTQLTDSPNARQAIPFPGSPRPASKSRPASETERAPEATAPLVLDRIGFVSRPVGSGRLVALPSANPFPGNKSLWNRIFIQNPTRNWLSYHRWGISQYSENFDFWNFLVPGIGRAPVISFLTLISMFAVVIGPVNYFYFRHRGRLNWLLVTVPAGSLLVTGGLFVFAIAADGFGVRVRLRSFTELDSRRGQATTVSRQTYYAGLAPSGGLRFPATAAVLPVEHRPLLPPGMHDRSRHLVWSSDQKLVSGYFLSRTMSQFLVVEPQATSAGIRVQVSSTDGEFLDVRNDLGADLECLFVTDRTGRPYYLQSLPQGSSGRVVPADLAAVEAEWRRQYELARPQLPPGIDRQSLNDFSQYFGNPGWMTNRLKDEPTLETSILEHGIREALPRKGRSFEPGKFAALLRKSPFVSLGIESPRQETGFHVVVGTWE